MSVNPRPIILVWIIQPSLDNPISLLASIFVRIGTRTRRQRWPTALWPKAAQANSIFLLQANILFAAGHTGHADQYTLYPIDTKLNPIIHGWLVRFNFHWTWATNDVQWKKSYWTSFLAIIQWKKIKSNWTPFVGYVALTLPPFY